MRNLFARESLGDAPPRQIAAPGGPRRPSAARLLFAPEPLPLDPEPPPAPPRRSLWSLLFAPEPLPLDPEPSRRRRSLPAQLFALFAPDVLPEDPPPPPRAARWRKLRWLFVPESLDPPGR